MAWLPELLLLAVLFSTTGKGVGERYADRMDMAGGRHATYRLATKYSGFGEDKS